MEIHKKTGHTIIDPINPLGALRGFVYSFATEVGTQASGML